MAEKRLIDADGLWSDIMTLPHNGDMISSEEVEQAIMDSPTVDAVEVVRCRDCVYGDMCSIREAMACTDDNGFCWRGKRRTNG